MTAGSATQAGAESHVPTLNEREDSTEIPEPIRTAVQILNKPSDHPEVTKHDLDYHERHGDSRLDSRQRRRSL